MGSRIMVNVKYATRKEATYGGWFEVSKFLVRKEGDRVYFSFEGEGDLDKAYIYLDPKIAIPLARNLLSVAEGYISEIESKPA